ncbi:unnamed protein product [Orchesella dallaii]|uniref:Uncharacterized protein n=1 Tax=Orchesella dallaii TaxID=48710 RepID=A0ABP1RWT5_9HEXA
MCDWLRTSFSVRETPEVLQRELWEINYVNFRSAAMYFHQAVRLMNRIDRSMSEQKRIGHLIKGIPEDIALKIYLMQPKTTMELKSTKWLPDKSADGLGPKSSNPDVISCKASLNIPMCIIVCDLVFIGDKRKVYLDQEPFS